MICSQELAAILEEEGFSEKAYPDPLSGAEPYTFGHGLTWITEAESAFIVEHRLPKIQRELEQRIPIMRHSHPEVQRVLIHMAYQLGVTGVTRFVNMLEALSEQDYARAADEMLDSKWARQTPNRAGRLSARIRALA